MTGSYTTGMRLGSFALILAGAFGTAYTLGERLPGHDHATNTTDMTDHGHDGNAPKFLLVTDEIGVDFATFHLTDSDGDTVVQFAKAHGALLRAVLVRPDLSGFQHVHPQIADDGSWTVAIDAPGPWHVVFESTPIVDGSPATSPVIATAELDDGTTVDAIALPEANDRVAVDGLVVTRDGFRFTVANADGSAATDLEPYLEQVAHLVALRQDDLAFTHLHPLASPVGTFDFGVGVTQPGTYRLFLQFGYAGDVITVPFTVVIS